LKLYRNFYLDIFKTVSPEEENMINNLASNSFIASIQQLATVLVTVDEAKSNP